MERHFGEESVLILFLFLFFRAFFFSDVVN